jgi:hypothetical protein
MMKSIKIGIYLFAIVSLFGCEKEINDYFYADTEEYVDTDILSLLKQNSNYSSYLTILEAHDIDTVFEKGKTLTLFVPTNEAIAEMGDLYLDEIDWIKYLITESYINIAQIQGKQKIQTLGEKFAVIESIEGVKYINGVKITAGSPLCKDGKFYEISGVVQPMPNLYEYIGLSNPFFKTYIDSQDSSYLDLELSRPIGYDSNGNTVYDTVLTTLNIFEEEFFPVSKEYRSKKATMLLFTQQQFDNAISLIAQDLGLPSADNIPNQWKNDVLMPYLIEQGTFWNDLEIADFASGRIRNIRGDSVVVVPGNIDAQSSFECSNGRAYNYLDFVIPDSIYKGETIIQGEHLIESKGSGLYVWRDDVVLGGEPVEPYALLARDIADNDTVLDVSFDGPNYSKEFSMTFTFKNIFPGRYRLLCRAKSKPSGVFQIFVNGELQDIDLGYGVSDRVDLYDLGELVRSVTKEVFIPQNGFNSFDILVNNITQYGDVDVTFKYVNPGISSDNGIIVDYFKLESF